MNKRIAQGFDWLAPYYDRLARLIIGRGIVNSQLHFLTTFKGGKRLLILGGGSGWILEYLCKECPGLQIDYIDLSYRMLLMAKRRVLNKAQVQFILGTEDDVPNQLYDGVITNYYLDMFDSTELSNVIEKVKRFLTKDALWVVTDFVNERKTHSIMLWWMYRFFNIITQIEAAHLPDWQQQMIQCGGTLLDHKKFKKGFITSNLYQLTDAINNK